MLLLFRRDHYFQNAYNHFNVRIACVAMSVRVIPLRIVPNFASNINPFHATGLSQYPLETGENQRFSDVFRGY